MLHVMNGAISTCSDLMRVKLLHRYKINANGFDWLFYSKSGIVLCFYDLFFGASSQRSEHMVLDTLIPFFIGYDYFYRDKSF